MRATNGDGKSTWSPSGIGSTAASPVRGEGEHPPERIYLCGAELGPETGHARDAKVDVCWETGSVISTGAGVAIEWRSRLFWDCPNPFREWAVFAPGSEFRSCTAGSATCVKFSFNNLIRGRPSRRRCASARAAASSRPRRN